MYNDANLYTLGKDVVQFPNGTGGHISSPIPLMLVSGLGDWPLLDWDKHLDGFANFAYTGKDTTFGDVVFNHVKPQFAMYAHRTCNDSYGDAGIVAYGTLQNDGCNPFSFQPLKQNEFGQVLLPLQKLSIGGIDVDVQPSGEAKLGSYFAISMPEAAFRQLNATLRASGTGYDLFVVDCSLKPGPMTFTFSDGVTYSIPFSQLVTNVDGVCTLNIMISWGDFVIGLPFLREYCIAVDYEKKRLGFATHRQPVTSECTYASEPKAPSCPDTLPKQCRATTSTSSTTISQSTTTIIDWSSTTKSSPRSYMCLLFVLVAVVTSMLISIN